MPPKCLAPREQWQRIPRPRSEWKPSSWQDCPKKSLASGTGREDISLARRGSGLRLHARKTSSAPDAERRRGPVPWGPQRHQRIPSKSSPPSRSTNARDRKRFSPWEAWWEPYANWHVTELWEVFKPQEEAQIRVWWWTEPQSGQGATTARGRGRNIF